MYTTSMPKFGFGLSYFSLGLMNLMSEIATKI